MMRTARKRSPRQTEKVKIDAVYDVVVVGGGPAGLAAAYSACLKGAEKVLIIERDREVGGILNQCVHNGFGLHYFKEELTGPEYAGRFAKMVENTSAEILVDTMVLEITPQRVIKCASEQHGYLAVKAGAIVLCMGCRERTRGAIEIPGDRCAGVLTAGTAQRYVNMEGYMPGRRVVILGSGDIGLIMARRMTLEGAKVLAVVELCPYSNGLNRNIVQCLNDYDIPLYLSHTITRIVGRERVEKVIISRVDGYRRIPGTELEIECDTVLLSVGLIPENELTAKAGIQIDPRTKGAVVYENMMTSVPGIFAAGNVVHVHDLVDFVTAESIRAGEAAAEYASKTAAGVSARKSARATARASIRASSGTSAEKAAIPIRADEEGIAEGYDPQDAEAFARTAESPIITVEPGDGVNYTVPQKIRPDNVEKSVDIFFRTNKIRKKSSIRVVCSGQKIAEYRREYMAPGEMEKITLPKVLLDRCNGAAGQNGDIKVKITVEDME